MEPRVLQYDDKGHGDPIVLVPGGFTGWVSWIPHEERLAGRYRAIRVQPIHNELGSAGVPGDPSYTGEVERESMRLTLDRLGLERPHVAAWSAGGTAVIEFAMEYPKRARSLTLVEPAAPWILEQLGEQVEDVERVNALIRGFFGRPVTEDELATFLEVAGFVEKAQDAPSHPNWGRWLIHRNTLSWLGEILDHPERSVEELARIRCPVLLTKGTRSTASDRRLVDVLGERLPDATVVELEGDHAHHVQSIDAFLAALETHLARAEGAATA